MSYLLDTSNELDLSNDSAVDVVTTTWVVEEATQESSESEKGTGTYEAITVSSSDWAYPITLRFFTEYESATNADTSWVKRSRGQLKNLAKAIFGEPKWNRTLAVGKSFIATTKDTGEGFATLSRYKKNGN